MRLIHDTQQLIEGMQLFDKLTGSYIPFILWPKQIEFLDVIHNDKKVVFLKKRQVAGSQLTGADSLAQCMLLDNFLVLILSKTGDDAKEYLKRASDMYNLLPASVKKACPLKGGDHPMDQMEFVNGSRIKSLAASKGAGYTADRVIIDEAGKINTKTSHITLDEVLRNVEPALEKAEGQLILVGTAEGYNLFQNYYARGKAGETSWKSFFFGCFDDPTFSAEKRDQIIVDHGEDHANENYPRTDDEAFLMSGRCRFNRIALTQMRDKTETGKVGYLQQVNDNVFFVSDPSGWVEIFEAPQPLTLYIGGFDVAEGIEIDGVVDTKNKTDYSAGSIINYNLDQVARIKCKLEPDVFKEEIMRLCEYYNNAFCGIERNKDGFGILLALKNSGYENLYYQEEFNPDKQVRNKKLGWLTDAKTKPLMVAHADYLIRNDKIKIRSIDTLNEFSTFVRFADGTTGAQESSHDDECIGLMIALYIQQYAPAELKLHEEEKTFAYVNSVKERSKNGGYGYRRR